jgi:uncharacterized iron-regulated membrane protein
MAKRSAQRNRWQRIREFFNDIHLWLGLTSGLVVVAICFSGTVYVFNTELTERAAPHLFKVKAGNSERRLSIDSLVEIVQRQSGENISGVMIPFGAEKSIQVNVRKKGDDSRGGVVYFINPYDGKVLGTSKEKNGTKEFMSTLFSLHRWLLLDKIEKPIIAGLPNKKLGSLITGSATILFTLGCLTGLIIWFPQKWKTWRQGLKIKWNAGWKRVNHDLHNTLAFYSVFFLLLMGLTGPQWSFAWYRDGLQKTLGIYKPKGSQEGKMVKDGDENDKFDLSKISVESLLLDAVKELPYEGNHQVIFPASAKGTVVISKTRSGFFAPAGADRLAIDPATGQVLKKEIFRDKPFNERIAGSIKAIHVGNVYGNFTKILYFLACLIATSLPVTGTMIWLNKLKKKRKKIVPPRKTATTLAEPVA